LKGGNYKVRAVVRDKTKEASINLQKRGVELFQGDMSKPEQIPDSAFKDVHGVFLLTDFWDPSTREKECELGMAMVDKIAKLGVKHLIFSTLPNCEEESNGKWKVVPFTQKAKIEDYIRGKKDKFDCITFVAPAFYYQNFLSWFKIAKDQQGNCSITMPQTSSLTAIDITEMGDIVRLCFDEPNKFNGKFVPIAGDSASPQNYVNSISKRLGINVELKSLPLETFAKSGGEELAQMFGWFDDFSYYGSRDWTMSKKLKPDMKNFDQWLSENIQSFREQASI